MAHYTRDTEVNQIDKLPAFVAHTLVGETSRKYVKKEFKNIIISHNKRIMKYKGWRHYGQTEEESSRTCHAWQETKEA